MEYVLTDAVNANLGLVENFVKLNTVIMNVHSMESAMKMENVNVN
jgi:hypothetical protein